MVVVVMVVVAVVVVVVVMHSCHRTARLGIACALAALLLVGGA